MMSTLESLGVPVQRTSFQYSRYYIDIDIPFTIARRSYACMRMARTHPNPLFFRPFGVPVLL
jgi:hypothetical protein